jgi:hypothetical protein
VVTTGGFEPPLDRLSTCCLCQGWATWPRVPPGGLEPPPHGLRARRAAFTPRREILELIPGIEPGRRPYQGRRLPLHQTSVERMAGLEPAPQGLEGPQATVTPHSPWFGLPVSIVDTQAERGPVAFTGPGTPVGCQRPHSCELVWRQRQDSNPDPRGLEARMLPLHHAVVPLSRLDHFRDKTSLRSGARWLPHVRPKQKRPSRGSPQKACFSMNAGPLGRFPLRIEHAAIGAVDPDRGHGSTHTGGDARGAGQMEWPS